MKSTKNCEFLYKFFKTRSVPVGVLLALLLLSPLAAYAAGTVQAFTCSLGKRQQGLSQYSFIRDSGNPTLGFGKSDNFCRHSIPPITKTFDILFAGINATFPDGGVTLDQNAKLSLTIKIQDAAIANNDANVLLCFGNSSRRVLLSKFKTQGSEADLRTFVLEDQEIFQGPGRLTALQIEVRQDLRGRPPFTDRQVTFGNISFETASTKAIMPNSINTRDFGCADICGPSLQNRLSALKQRLQDRRRGR